MAVCMAMRRRAAAPLQVRRQALEPAHGGQARARRRGRCRRGACCSSRIAQAGGPGALPQLAAVPEQIPKLVLALIEPCACAQVGGAPAERAERSGAQARLAALEAVVQGTEAELARLRQSKAVNNMVRMYQGARAAFLGSPSMPSPRSTLAGSTER